MVFVCIAQRKSKTVEGEWIIERGVGIPDLIIFGIVYSVFHECSVTGRPGEICALLGKPLGCL